MAENNSSSTPTQGDLQSWATNYGMTFPVLSDVSWSIFYDVWGGGGIPQTALVAPGGRLVSTNYPSSSDIEAVLPM